MLRSFVFHVLSSHGDPTCLTADAHACAYSVCTDLVCVVAVQIFRVVLLLLVAGPAVVLCVGGEHMEGVEAAAVSKVHIPAPLN